MYYGLETWASSHTSVPTKQCDAIIYRNERAVLIINNEGSI